MGSGTVALGVVGNITAMVMFFSPLPTFIIIRKNRDTGRFSAFPYLCTLMNCLLWFFYGLPMISENNTLVMTINGAGIMVESLYLMFFLYYAAWPVKTRVLRSLVFVILFCAITFAITLGAFQGDNRTTFLGSINVIINTLMYAAPLSVMRMVIETKSVEYMPFLLSLCSFVNATLWALYGVLKQDKFIIIPNGLGVLLGGLQLALYAKYRKFKPPPGAFTEEIAAAYTTEGTTSAGLSDVALDISDAVTKGATSAQAALTTSLKPEIRPSTQPLITTSTTVKPPEQAQGQPSMDKPRERPHDKAKREETAGPPRIQEAPLKQIAETRAAGAAPAAKLPIPPLQPVAAAPQLHAPTTMKAPTAPSTAPATAAPAATKAPAATQEDAARKEQEAFALMKKAEEEKRADELRRLQEAFDEDEYGAELETIFL